MSLVAVAGGEPPEEQSRFTHTDFVAYLKEIDDNAATHSPVRVVMMMMMMMTMMMTTMTTPFQIECAPRLMMDFPGLGGIPRHGVIACDECEFAGGAVLIERPANHEARG